MKRYRVLVSEFAAENIREAYHRLQAEDPVYATRWLAEIRQAVERLGTFPEAHPRAPENAAFDKEIRHLPVGKRNPWRVLFTIDGECVTVLHVRHSHRDFWWP